MSTATEERPSPKSIAVAILVMLACAACAADPRGDDPLAESRQLLLVRTPGWSAVDGTLQRYERATGHDLWRPVGAAIPVVVGGHGLAWGRGRHPRPLEEPLNAAPTKREGDGCAPAGVFALGTAFGYAPAAEVTWLRWPYRQATSTLRCVDDPASAFYNQLVEDRPDRDWQSAEMMRRRDELYRFGVFVQHNSAPVAAASGSCIFLHIWQGPGQGTAGCTAMAAGDLIQLLGWLDPQAAPLLVQLPDARLPAARRAWALPE